MTANTDPIEWQLLDTDLTTVLAILPVGEQKLYLEMSEPGSGEVRIPMESAAAALIASGQFARAKYRGAYRGGFFVENIKTTDASGGEAGDEWKSISGRGALALLDDAIVWDDGTVNSTRQFSAASMASVLIDLIDEAQARGGLAILTYDFTASQDSDGNAWTDSQPLELTVGKSLLAIARDFARKGLEFDVTLETDGTFTLHAYNVAGMGTDKSATIYFRIGTNCTEVSGEELGGGIKNVLRVKYKDGFTTVQDGTSISARRRREALVSEESAGNSDAAITFGQSRLENAKDPQNSININLYDGVRPYAFVEYSLGDRVTLDRKGTQGDYRVRGMQLSWAEDYADVVLSLNSTIIENEIRMALEIERLQELWTRLTDSGLPITSFWSALGLPGDTVTRVNDMVIIGTKLYIAFGDMTDSTLVIGGITARGVACLDLETGLWAPLSDGGLLGLSGTGRSLAGNGTDLYIGGDFNNPGGIGLGGALLVKYDTLSKAWSGVGNFTVPFPQTRLQASPLAMVVSDGVLYCGGTGIGVGGDPDMDHIAMYTIATNTWSQMGSGTAGPVLAIAVDGSNVYAGGSAGLEVFNGTSWTLLSNLGGGSCKALSLWRSGLAVGGDFSSPGNNIAYYDFETPGFSALGNGLNDVCQALTTIATDLYATGMFTQADGITVNRAAKHNGGSWVSLQEGLSGTTGTDGYAVLGWELNVIFGGDFERAGNKPAKAIAVFLTTLEDVLDYLDQAGEGGVLHNDLPDVQGGDPDADELYHLTQAEHDDLTSDGDASGQHHHDGRYPRKWTGKTTAPTVNDDSDDGYAVSDRWIDETNDKEYVALDVTVGAAVWTETTGAGGGGGTPGGSDTEIQVNEAGSFAGYPWLRVDPVNYLLLFGDGDPPIPGSRGWHFVGDGVSPFGSYWAFGADYAGFHKFLKAGGTKASPSALVNDTPVGRIRYQGYGASAWAGGSGVQVEGFATEDWDDSNQGMGWRVGITPRGFTWANREWVFEATEDGINLLGTSHYLNKSGQEYVSYLFENAISKINPDDGDKFGYWDEASGEIRQIPWSVHPVVTGWIPVHDTWTYASADDPVYQIYVSGDRTADPDYKLGNKVKCTNNSTTFQGFIVKVGSYDGVNDRTPVDIYGGTDYDLANSAISAPHISKVKSPDGFPMSPAKWTIKITDSTDYSKTSPAGSTWYGGTNTMDGGVTLPSMTIPIGVWRVSYKVVLRVAITTTYNFARIDITLSTAGASVSDSEFTLSSSLNASAGGTGATPLVNKPTLMSPEILVELNTKATHRILLSSTNGANDVITLQGGSGGTTLLKAECAFL